MMNKEELVRKLESLSDWKAPEIYENIPHGDMPGDKIQIGEGHIEKAKTIFPLLIKELVKADKEKVVVSVFGGSGVGKSETASLLAYFLQSVGIGAYIISGDNYPYRIPLYNDAERLSIFRANGLKGLVEKGVYSEEVQLVLNKLWEEETDPNPELIKEYPWLETYQRAGRSSLKEYLGTSKEQDYVEINEIISKFKTGAESIWLKRMGRDESQRYYSAIDFANVNVLILEWTHGNNEALEGLDVPVLLNSTPEETREHRRSRARDGKTDSAFTTMVLEIEQEELDDRAKFAKIIIAKSGELLDPASF